MYFVKVGRAIVGNTFETPGDIEAWIMRGGHRDYGEGYEITAHKVDESFEVKTKVELTLVGAKKTRKIRV